MSISDGIINRVGKVLAVLIPIMCIGMMAALAAPLLWNSDPFQGPEIYQPEDAGEMYPGLQIRDETRAEPEIAYGIWVTIPDKDPWGHGPLGHFSSYFPVHKRILVRVEVESLFTWVKIERPFKGDTLWIDVPWPGAVEIREVRP